MELMRRAVAFTVRLEKYCGRYVKYKHSGLLKYHVVCVQIYFGKFRSLIIYLAVDMT